MDRLQTDPTRVNALEMLCSSLLCRGQLSGHVQCARRVYPIARHYQALLKPTVSKMMSHSWCVTQSSLRLGT